jgi:hypothetical protein
MRALYSVSLVLTPVDKAHSGWGPQHLLFHTDNGKKTETLMEQPDVTHQSGPFTKPYTSRGLAILAMVILKYLLT